MAGRFVTVLEDLNCPFCFVLSETLEREGLTDRTVWQGIEHAPDAAVPWAAPSPGLKEMICSEVETARERAPWLTIAIPPRQPNTRLAMCAVAEALGRDIAAGHRLRHAIKRALWQGGQDISDPALIAQLRVDAGLAPDFETTTVASQLEAWRQAWLESDPRMIPTLVSSDGARRPGLGNPAEAVEFVRAHSDAGTWSVAS